MKQNLQTVYLQISTAQGPAECRIFARFVLGRLSAEYLCDRRPLHSPRCHFRPAPCANVFSEI